jgi:predicted ATP-binding protein involved in virulence
MQVDITIKNFRCFADVAPARLTLHPGVTAIVGKNNSGKSALLKFFYELRHLFENLRNRGEFAEAVRGNPRGGDSPRRSRIHLQCSVTRTHGRS